MLGSTSPLPPGVTALPRPQSFRGLVTSLYVYSVSFRGLVRILDLLGCGVGAATLWQDVQAVAPGRRPDPQATLPTWVAVDETSLSIGGIKRPVVLGPKGERLDLRLSDHACPGLPPLNPGRRCGPAVCLSPTGSGPAASGLGPRAGRLHPNEFGAEANQPAQVVLVPARRQPLVGNAHLQSAVLPQEVVGNALENDHVVGGIPQGRLRLN